MRIDQNRRDVSYNMLLLTKTLELEGEAGDNIGNGIELVFKTKDTNNVNGRTREMANISKTQSNETTGDDTGEDRLQFWSDNQGGTFPFCDCDISGIPPSIGFGLKGPSLASRTSIKQFL